MEQARYRWFLDEVAQWASADPSVIGLVALGSAANRSHAPDEWSDHDLWVITLKGAAAALRGDPSWLPDSERIVGWFAETEHGRSAVYDDGHLVEVAIFEDSELEVARANDFRVLYDAGGIGTRLASISQRTTAEGGDRAEHPAGRFVVEMIIGLGRLGRGELLSANELIRGRAVTSLLRSVAARASSDSEMLDNLDPHRRFELAYPGIARRIGRSLERPLIEVARSLVETAGDVLPTELLPRSVVEVLDHRIEAVRATQTDPTQGS